MKDLLIDEIYKVFSNTRPPNKDEITVCDCWECLDLREKFSNADENKILNDLVENQPEALNLFSEKAFHHYFKYFLIASLKNMKSKTFENTIIRLSPNDEESINHLEGKLKYFTINQLEIIQKFIDELESIYVENPDYGLYDDAFTIARKTIKNFITKCSTRPGDKTPPGR